MSGSSERCRYEAQHAQLWPLIYIKTGVLQMVYMHPVQGCSCQALAWPDAGVNMLPISRMQPEFKYADSSILTEKKKKDCASCPLCDVVLETINYLKIWKRLLILETYTWKDFWRSGSRKYH